MGKRVCNAFAVSPAARAGLRIGGASGCMKCGAACGGNIRTCRIRWVVSPGALIDAVAPAGIISDSVTPDERWLAALWPFVQNWLPPPPGPVAEIGCGPLGGFVPMLRSVGYDATGVDPEAPAGPWYRRVEFEHHAMAGSAGAVVACTSLHHVADIGVALDLIGAALRPGGLLVIVEWARERFDEATAQWCFGQLPPLSGDPGWLQRRRDQWRESGQPWDVCLRSWAEGEGLHDGQHIVRELDARFDRQLLAYGPYFFAELAGVSHNDEQAAIDAGEIQANRIEYVGRRRRS